MQREIEFRGKTKEGEWIYGWYTQKPIGKGFYYIGIENKNGHFQEVIPSTVGQYIESKDKNGVKIFEGDIDDKGRVIKYLPELSGYYLIKDDEALLLKDCMAVNNIKIKGNIHDNPELLKT